MPLPFPNVPIALGVPPLPRSPVATVAAISLLVADAISFFGLSIAPRWGIFRDGLPVVIADSVVTFDYKRDWTIANYPVEKGAFESYDKVSNPFEPRIRFAAGGSEVERQLLLDSIAAIAGTLDLYDVVTPEVIYQSANITHYDYRRSAHSGVGLLVIDVWLMEVRVTATSAFTKSASSASVQNNGIVQPTRISLSNTDPNRPQLVQ